MECGEAIKFRSEHCNLTLVLELVAAKPAQHMQPKSINGSGNTQHHPAGSAVHHTISHMLSLSVCLHVWLVGSCPFEAVHLVAAHAEGSAFPGVEHQC